MEGWDREVEFGVVFCWDWVVEVEDEFCWEGGGGRYDGGVVDGDGFFGWGWGFGFVGGDRFEDWVRGGRGLYWVGDEGMDWGC